MGTRADFYVGRGKGAEWLGSIAWDGYPEGIGSKSMDPEALLGATDERGYREAVASFFAERDDATLSENGWPWPWDNSQTTDYSYTFDAGKVWVTCFGWPPWLEATKHLAKQETDDDYDPWESSIGKKLEFPDMSERKNVVIGGLRSGMIVLTNKGVFK